MSGCKTNNKQKNSERTRSPNISHQGLLENREKILKIPRLKKKIIPKAQIAQRNFVNEEKRGDFFKTKKKNYFLLRNYSTA